MPNQSHMIGEGLRMQKRFLKKIGSSHPDYGIIGFFDESAPRTTANTVRLWSFYKLEIVKDTSKYRANTFGFYSLNGNSVVDFQNHSRKENVVSFLRKIREQNPGKTIMIILYNF